MIARNNPLVVVRIVRTWALAALIVAIGSLLIGQSTTSADPGLETWPSSSHDFSKRGPTWPSGYPAAADASDDAWRNGTDWDPDIVIGSLDDELRWDDASDICSVPTGGDLAVTCVTSIPFGDILEADIIFNGDPDDFTWTADRVKGIATHEMGHAGGLWHELFGALCGDSDSSRATMCPKWSNTNAPWATSLESIDISDVNSMY